MADLGKTDSQWDRFMGREIGSMLLAPLRELRETADKFRRNREQVRLHRAVSTFLDESVGVTVSGADPGNNCTEDGLIYVRITGSGPYTVSWYSTTGGSGLVAQGSANAGASATMAAQNSSGLSGTWELPGSVSTTSGDELWFEAVVDYPQRLSKVFTETDGIADDRYSSDVLSAAYAAVASAIDSAKDTLKSSAVQFLLTNGSVNPIARGNAFLESNKTALISDESKGDGSGNVVRVRDGLFPRASTAMNDETTGSEQFVIKRTVSAAAGVFEGDNDGLGAVASHTPGQACPELKVTFKCVAGADTGNIGAERFSVEYAYTKDGDERRISPGDELTVKKAFTGLLEFGPITLTRTYSKTGDGSNNIFTAASNAVVTGETNSNTDDGVLHWETTGSGPYTISFYKSASLAESELVAQASSISSGASFSATAQNSSGLQVDWQLGGTESATSGTLNINPFRVQRSADRQPDTFSVTVSLTGTPGIYQTILSEEFPGASLNATTSGSETIKDEYVKQGTFAPYSVQDN